MTRARALLVTSMGAPVANAVPLGTMAVATTLQRRHDLPCTLIDLPHGRSFDHFWSGVELRDVVFAGFSTICTTLPRTLSLARALKEQHPSMPIVLGGPGVSADPDAILAAYPFIDVVVAGEADAILGDLVNALRDRRASSVMRGVPPDLDAIEPIDYATWPASLARGRLSVDAGRGCPYACTFCSTSGFFRRRFRMKSVERIVSEIEAVRRDHAIDRIDLLHDAFTIDRRRVEQLCEAFLSSPRRIRWTCSARTDSVDAELLALMRRAGCEAVYFGLETGSQRMQKRIGKNLDVARAITTLRMAQRYVDGTASLIVGFPFEERADLAATLDAVLCLRAAGLASVQLHLLAPAPATELFDEYRSSLRYDGFRPAGSAIESLTPWETSEIRRRPEIFASFYYYANPSVPRAVYRELQMSQGTRAITRRCALP